MVLSMERWEGKVAIVTGASSGIGAAIAEKLVEEGLIVVGLARRSEKIDEISRRLKDKKGKLHSFRADFSKEDDILIAFRWIKENIGPVSILINNAAVLFQRPVIEGKTNEWKTTFDVNVIGLCIATREAIKIMTEYNVDGHIVNINSLSGHRIVPHTGIYAPSKFAVTALTETLRLELNDLNFRIKVTSVSSGAVDTATINTAKTEDPQRYAQFKLQPEEVAEGVIYALSTPPHVQIQELMLRHIGQLR